MAFIPLQEYKMAVDGGATAETAINLALPTELGIQGQMQVMLTAINTNITVKLGASGVTADATLTDATARAAGNFTVKQDAILLVGVKESQTYISAISEDESTTGTLYITVGYNSNA